MSDPQVNGDNTPWRSKLGLALAGGGFRASLFHLGVLRRMAELDLLRSVEALSTVSGGSIIGALYILLLKERLDRSATLTRDQYVEIIEELDRILVEGIKKNLRTRLFMNPFGLLRVLITNDTLGRRMARIYERYLYRTIVNKLQPTSWWKDLWRPGRIRLRDIRVKPGGEEVKAGIESYNRIAVARRGSAITSLVLNATSLNSGVPFRFSSVEIGDSRLGFFRYSEIKALQKRKKLLFECKLSELQARLAKSGEGRVTVGKADYDQRTVSLALWWRSRKDRPEEPSPSPAGWEALFALTGFPGCLADTEFGLLRRIKLSAWYIRKGPGSDPPVDGGLTNDEHRAQFWEGMGRISEDRAKNLEEKVRNSPALETLLLDFVLELYYLRSAEVMSPNLGKHWDRLRLGEAVGASACFPPVFPPFIVLDFYDDWHVSRLGLTDGGVYDNVGLTALFEERCNYIIASDTSGLFDVAQRSSAGRLGMSGRIVSILMDDVAGHQRELLRDRRNCCKRMEEIASSTNAGPEAWSTGEDLRGLAFYHINSPPTGDGGLQLNLDRRLLASIRTDLDGFGDVEIAALVNHGYDTADRYLRQYFADYPHADKSYWMPPQREPKPIRRPGDEVKKILKAGRSRFFRALKLGAPLSILFTAAAFLAAVWGTWGIKVSVQDAIMKLAQASFGWMESTIPYFGAGWTKYRMPAGVVILLGTAAVALWTLIPPDWIDRLRNRYLPWFSRLATVSKWSRSLVGNLLWLFGPVPLVMALAGAAIGWVSHVFYYLPFARKTRNRKP
jgi:predicted acylesterase/phospholipase RssA